MTKKGSTHEKSIRDSLNYESFIMIKSAHSEWIWQFGADTAVMVVTLDSIAMSISTHHTVRPYFGLFWQQHRAQMSRNNHGRVFQSQKLRLHLPLFGGT